MHPTRLTNRAFRWSIFITAAVLAIALSTATPVAAQDTSTRTTVSGTVVSHTGSTLLIKTADGRYSLFVLTRDTVKPKDLADGSDVRVTSTPTDDPAVRLAIVVTGVPTGAAATPAEEPSIIPDAVRNAERGIQREAKRFNFGFQGGMTMNPELIDVGIHARFGPFFSRNLTVRPSVDFAWGEVTRMFSISPELIYRIPFTVGAKKYVYFGGGPGFNFVQQTFERGQGVNFSDFNYDSALNLLLGIQHRAGMFVEMKTSVYASPAPVLRVIVGYSF